MKVIDLNEAKANLEGEVRSPFRLGPRAGPGTPIS